MKPGPECDHPLNEIGNMPDRLQRLDSAFVRFGAVLLRPTDARKGKFYISALDKNV